MQEGGIFEIEGVFEDAPLVPYHAEPLLSTLLVTVGCGRKACPVPDVTMRTYASAAFDVVEKDLRGHPR
jgi:hypothetical protein